MGATQLVNVYKGVKELQAGFSGEPALLVISSVLVIAGMGFGNKGSGPGLGEYLQAQFQAMAAQLQKVLEVTFATYDEVIKARKEVRQLHEAMLACTDLIRSDLYDLKTEQKDHYTKLRDRLSQMWQELGDATRALVFEPLNTCLDRLNSTAAPDVSIPVETLVEQALLLKRWIVSPPCMDQFNGYSLVNSDPGRMQALLGDDTFPLGLVSHLATKLGINLPPTLKTDDLATVIYLPLIVQTALPAYLSVRQKLQSAGQLYDADEQELKQITEAIHRTEKVASWLLHDYNLLQKANEAYIASFKRFVDSIQKAFDKVTETIAEKRRKIVEHYYEETLEGFKALTYLDDYVGENTDPDEQRMLDLWKTAPIKPSTNPLQLEEGVLFAQPLMPFYIVASHYGKDHGYLGTPYGSGPWLCQSTLLPIKAEFEALMPPLNHALKQLEDLGRGHFRYTISPNEAAPDSHEIRVVLRRTFVYEDATEVQESSMHLGVGGGSTISEVADISAYNYKGIRGSERVSKCGDRFYGWTWHPGTVTRTLVQRWLSNTPTVFETRFHLSIEGAQKAASLLEKAKKETWMEVHKHLDPTSAIGIAVNNARDEMQTARALVLAIGKAMNLLLPSKCAEHPNLARLKRAINRDMPDGSALLADLKLNKDSLKHATPLPLLYPGGIPETPALKDLIIFKQIEDAKNLLKVVKGMMISPLGKPSKDPVMQRVEDVGSHLSKQVDTLGAAAISEIEALKKRVADQDKLIRDLYAMIRPSRSGSVPQ